MSYKNHALVRTSPTSGPFIGRCVKCGLEGLTLSQGGEPCHGKMSDESALINIIEGTYDKPKNNTGT